jgi:hypothetical protein
VFSRGNGFSPRNPRAGIPRPENSKPKSLCQSGITHLSRVCVPENNERGKLLMNVNVKQRQKSHCSSLIKVFSWLRRRRCFSNNSIEEENCVNFIFGCNLSHPQFNNTNIANAERRRDAERAREKRHGDFHGEAKAHTMKT